MGIVQVGVEDHLAMVLQRAKHAFQQAGLVTASPEKADSETLQLLLELAAWNASGEKGTLSAKLARAHEIIRALRAGKPESKPASEHTD